MASMSILKRLRDRLAAVRDTFRDPADPSTDRLGLSAEIPGAGGAPLWKIDVQVLTEPHGDGEKMRLRAHLQSNFGSALRPALDQKPRRNHARTLASSGRALTRSQRIGQLAQRAASRALRTPVVRAVAESLLRYDFNTWVEVQASTASLDKGSQDLVPAQEQLARLGIKPRNFGKAGSDGPVAETWAGEAPGGFAQVSLLQIDKRHLPPKVAESLGGKPFSMAAAIVNVVEEK
jgi:hypothetical protein